MQVGPIDRTLVSGLRDPPPRAPPRGRTSGRGGCREGRARLGEAGKGGRTGPRESEAGGETRRPSETALGAGSKRCTEAPIIIIAGNGAEAPSSSALFYIIGPRPRRTRTALGSSRAESRAPGPLCTPPAPAPPAALKFRCAPPGLLTCLTHLPAPGPWPPRPAASLTCDKSRDTDWAQS